MLQGAGLGYRRDLADDFLNLSSNNAIQFMEVAPENWVKMGGAALYADYCFQKPAPEGIPAYRDRYFAGIHPASIHLSLWLPPNI